MADGFRYPRLDRLAQLAQAAFEEMIGTFDQHQFFRFRDRLSQSFQLGARAEGIASSADEQLGCGAGLQEIEVVNSGFFQACGDGRDRRSHADERTYPCIVVSRAQADRGAKRKSGKNQRQMESCVKPVERGPYVFDFTLAVVVLALAQSRATEVEAQHGKSEVIQRLHGVKHNFIVQGSAKQRMRMADHRGVARIASASIEQRLQAPGRAVDIERSNG